MAPITSDESIARFILTRSHINWEKPEQPRLRPEAFMPHPRIELSVFRVAGLDARAVNQIGVEVAKKRQKTLVGHGDLKIADVAPPLSVQPKEPPPRHADIVGWPALSGNGKEDKGRQKLLAQQLVEKAELVLV